MFRYCETKQFWWKIVIGARLSYPKHFPLPEDFWNSERFVYQIFQYCQSKHIRRQIVIPPVLSTQVFLNQRVSQAQECSSTKSFGTVRQNIFGKKSRYSSPHSLMHRNFHYRKLSVTQKSSSTKCFGTVRRNNFDGKFW